MTNPMTIAIEGMKQLFTRSVKFMSEEKTVEVKNEKITIIVNGENIDPKSVRGKKILKEMGKAVNSIEQAVEDIGKVTDRLGNL